MAFAVDAYIPDVQGLNQILAINGLAPGTNPTVQPGEEITYTLEIRNFGSESISGGNVVIPVPYTASFLSADVEAYFNPNTVGTPYFDPTLGATGSIVWPLGNIPLPENPSELLAKMTYKFKVTEDCFILANADCEAYVSVNGVISGKGDISESEFTSIQLTQGFLDGDCEGEPIQTPLIIPIMGASDWVFENCNEADVFKVFFFCNVDSNNGIAVNN